MRTIKFRAWDDKKKRWLLEYKALGGFSLFGETVIFDEWGATADSYIFERHGRKLDDLKVMQFTGLLDKNGREIYEGDIWRSTAHPEHKPTVVEWRSLSTGYQEAYGYGFFEPLAYVEVIGNIYENPELLKEAA